MFFANANDLIALGRGGKVEIHAQDADGDDPPTESHPCDFFVVGHGFAGGSLGEYSIQRWPPSRPSGVVVAQGTWTADAFGDWQTIMISLANGHYRLSAEQLTPAAKKEARKTFWVECGPPPVIPEAGLPALLPLTAAAVALSFAVLRARERPGARSGSPAAADNSSALGGMPMPTERA